MVNLGEVLKHLDNMNTSAYFITLKSRQKIIIPYVSLKVNFSSVEKLAGFVTRAKQLRDVLIFP